MAMMFIRACIIGDINGVRDAIDKKVSLSNEGFRYACFHGHNDIVQLLLSLDETWEIDPSELDNQAFRMACEEGRVEVVKTLLSLDESRGVDPSVYRNQGLMWACMYGYVEIIHILLTLDKSRGVDPSDKTYSYFCDVDESWMTKDLLLDFLHHPKFYPYNNEPLPIRVQQKVDDLSQKFDLTTFGKRAKPSRYLEA